MKRLKYWKNLNHFIRPLSSGLIVEIYNTTFL